MNTHICPASRRIATVILITCCLAPNGWADELAVPGDFATIGAAISASMDGDTILVGPGTYNEAINLGPKVIAIRSVAGAGATTIQQAGNSIANISGGAELSGFTIEGCCGVRAFGIGAVISGNIFDGSTNLFSSSAISGNNASPIISGNIFRNQPGPSGFSGGVISLVNNSSPLIVNNVFENNTGISINLTLPSDTNPRVINNTFVDNETALRVDRRVVSSSYEIRNNLIVGNEIGLTVEFGTEANNPTFENNLVFGNDTNYEMIADQTGMNGNLSVDPLLVDLAGGDYQLTGLSPAIDAGSSLDAPLIDLLGAARPQNGDFAGGPQFDIGAYEFAVPEPASALLLLVASCLAFERRRV